MSNIITKIEVGKKNKNRVNIFINGEFSFACSTDLVYYYKLEKGKQVDLSLLKDIIHEDSYIKGKSDALRSLEKSYKSEKEIVQKLLEKGYDEKVIDRIIEFLKQYNFINDKKYTQMFVRDKSLSIGRNKIRYMLQKKGIENSIIEQEIGNLDESFENQTALKLAKKKFHIVKKSEPNIRKIYKKVGDYLVSKGYDFNIITSILNQVIDCEEYDENDEKVDIDNHNYKEEAEEKNLSKLKELAEKRYIVISKLENDKTKINRKLSEYLIRRGYNWQDVKKILKEIVEDE